MTPSRRVFVALAATSAASLACQTGAPRKTVAAPSAGTEFVQAYVSQSRILRGQGDVAAATLRYGQPATGACDMAVVVRRAALVDGTLRFSLEVLGVPKLERTPACRKPPAGIGLTITGVPAGASADVVTTAIDATLQTPEAYLASHGIAFDRPAGGDDPDVATQVASASQTEKSLGRKVSEWPKRLLSIDAYSHDTTGRQHTSVELEFEAIVGRDGRLHRAKCATGLSENDQGVFDRAVSLWRFEPAQGRDGPVAARMAYRLSFTSY